MLFTPLRILFGGLMLTAVVLAALNPGPAKFEEFLQDRLTAEAAAQQAEASGGALSGSVTDFLTDRLGRAARTGEEEAFTRENYLVWSVYLADLNGARADGEAEFLGIGGTFIRLVVPEALQNL